MKKTILFIVFAICAMLTFSSCVSPAYAQGVEITECDGNVDINVIVRYGTPYYYEGSILYYMYDGFYYYPRLIDNHWRYYRYARPLPPPRHYHNGYHSGRYNPHRSSTYKNYPGHRNGGNIHHPNRPNRSMHSGGSINRHPRPSGNIHSRPSGGGMHSGHHQSGPRGGGSRMGGRR